MCHCAEHTDPRMLSRRKSVILYCQLQTSNYFESFSVFTFPSRSFFFPILLIVLFLVDFSLSFHVDTTSFFKALHCYVDTATKPAPRIQYSSHKQRPPNGLNVTFPAFVHLPTVLLNQSALKDYLIGALKVTSLIFITYLVIERMYFVCFFLSPYL